MKEEKKGFNIRALLFRDTEGSTQTETTSPQAAPGIPQVQVQTNNVASPLGVASAHPTSVGIINQSLVEDFVDRLQKLIDDNNQPGFDFLEFTQSLFESSQNPSENEYRMVFNIAKKMQANLSSKSLLDSARMYKELAGSAALSVVTDGNTKKEQLTREMEEKRSNLEGGVKTNTDEIKKLEKKIEDLKKDSATKTGDLNLIQQEYDPQFIDIDSKIAAMNLAKEKVINSIVDVETGISNYIKI